MTLKENAIYEEQLFPAQHVSTYFSSSLGFGMYLIQSRFWKFASIQLRGVCCEKKGRLWTGGQMLEKFSLATELDCVCYRNETAAGVTISNFNYWYTKQTIHYATDLHRRRAGFIHIPTSHTTLFHARGGKHSLHINPCKLQRTNCKVSCGLHEHDPAIGFINQFQQARTWPSSTGCKTALATRLLYDLWFTTRFIVCIGQELVRELCDCEPLKSVGGNWNKR